MTLAAGCHLSHADIHIYPCKLEQERGVGLAQIFYNHAFTIQRINHYAGLNPYSLLTKSILIDRRGYRGTETCVIGICAKWVKAGIPLSAETGDSWLTRSQQNGGKPYDRIAWSAHILWQRQNLGVEHVSS